MGHELAAVSKLLPAPVPAGGAAADPDVLDAEAPLLPAAAGGDTFGAVVVVLEAGPVGTAVVVVEAGAGGNVVVVVATFVPTPGEHSEPDEFELPDDELSEAGGAVTG